MKIVYNLNCLRAPMTGIGYYTQNMVLAMIRHYPDLEITAFRHNTLLSKKEILTTMESVSTISSTAAWKTSLIEIINHSAAARALIQGQHNLQHRFTLKNAIRGQIYHEPNFVFLPHHGPKVLTLHDIAMFACPEFLPQGRAKFLQQQLRRSLQEAQAIIVSCQFIKEQTVALLNIAAHTIHVIPPATSTDFKPRLEAEIHACLNKNALNYKKFLLCVATLEPRKNLIRLIHAYQALPIALQQHYPLVLVGNKGWLYEALLQVIQASHPSPILLLRYVDEQTLFHLYSGAKAFVYPSLYEGFGLPVLEAMQSGLPVITSNVSSLPEVCGDAGILIDPQDESALAAAMQTLLTVEEPRYQELVQRSLAQAKKFSWKNFAQKLFTTYQNINSIPSPAGGRRWP